MHFQKLYAVICVAALVGAISPNVQGADTDAQARARELLHQKMAELNGQPAAKPTPSEAAKPTPPAIVEPAPVASQAPAAKVVIKEAPAPEKPMPAVVAVSEPVRAPGSLSPEQEEQVREAMRQEKARLDAIDHATVAATPAVKQKPAAAELTTGKKDVASKTEKSEKKMKEAAAKEKKEQDVRAAKAAMAAEVKSASAKPAPVAPAPANLVPGSKEQRLYDLLQQYKADKVTPSEYHLQRSKILAE